MKEVGLNATTRTFAGLVPGISLAAFLAAGCNEDNGATESVKPPPATTAAGNLGFDGDWECVSDGKKLYAEHKFQSGMFRCGSKCTGAIGCGGHVLQVNDTIVRDGLGVTRQGLELQDDVNPRTACRGNCGPINSESCGGPGVTFDGAPYTDRWICMAALVDGVCRMNGRTSPCDEGTTCEETGDNPASPAECNLIAVCEVDADCANANPCDGDETCVAGQCAPGQPLDPDDGFACTADRCIAGQGIVNESVDGRCADGNLCNGVETCDPAAEGANAAGCVAGNPINPDDANSCTDDRCDPVTGNVTNLFEDLLGVACDDENACTGEGVEETAVCVRDGETAACRGQEICELPEGLDASCATPACENLACGVDLEPNGQACNPQNPEARCVAGACEPFACNINQTPNQCIQDGQGNLGFYRCITAPGEIWGTLQLVELCPGRCFDGDIDAVGCVRACQNDGQCPEGQRCDLEQQPAVCVERDSDGDGVPDFRDSCPRVANPNQEDGDGDGVGNACDNCIDVANPGQANADGDLLGDACDPEDAGDSCTDGLDNDGDGDIDCDDAGCAAHPACQPPAADMALVLRPNEGVQFNLLFVNIASDGCEGVSLASLPDGTVSVSGTLTNNGFQCRMNFRDVNGAFLPRCNGNVDAGEPCNEFAGFTVVSARCEGEPGTALVVPNALGNGRDLRACWPADPIACVNNAGCPDRLPVCGAGGTCGPFVP